MQSCASNTSGDVDRVIPAVCLDIGISQSIAQLKAVLSPLPP